MGRRAGRSDRLQDDRPPIQSRTSEGVYVSGRPDDRAGLVNVPDPNLDRPEPDTVYKSALDLELGDIGGGVFDDSGISDPFPYGLTAEELQRLFEQPEFQIDFKLSGLSERSTETVSSGASG